jgi:hypothetical protein
MLQPALAAVAATAASTTAAATRASTKAAIAEAVQPLQHQLQDMQSVLCAVTAQAAGAVQDIRSLSDWKASGGCDLCLRVPSHHMFQGMTLTCDLWLHIV